MDLQVKLYQKDISGNAFLEFFVFSYYYFSHTKRGPIIRNDHLDCDLVIINFKNKMVVNVS